ncbi:hypothetical protein C7B62_18305 [Pleurocapsa sp. CCALA 161]|uniref:transposase family protein n=1 Tax=Pleurocapsa sp. CCALA 161 TaxID=2107688 RepID=UPI000D048957|nr:hypothetical protein C7B62_18305 [Pleurocapsa sp. CCALA 161]
MSISETENQITIQVKTQNLPAVCPICNSTSNRVHSNYQRSLDDVSWGNYQFCLKLSTQKFFCSNLNCERQIFTQRLPKIVSPWARRTERLNTQLTKIGLAEGGLPGSRLTQHLSVKISHQELETAQFFVIFAAQSSLREKAEVIRVVARSLLIRNIFSHDGILVVMILKNFMLKLKNKAIKVVMLL